MTTSELADLNLLMSVWEEDSSVFQALFTKLQFGISSVHQRPPPAVEIFWLNVPDGDDAAFQTESTGLIKQVNEGGEASSIHLPIILMSTIDIFFDVRP